MMELKVKRHRAGNPGVKNAQSGLKDLHKEGNGGKPRECRVRTRRGDESKKQSPLSFLAMDCLAGS